MATDRTGGDRGVSKVLGNVLVVAIVVILSALVGPFAFDMAQKATSDPAPASVFGFEENADGGVTIAYDQGPTLDTENLRLEGSDPDGNVSFGPWPTNGTLSSGDRVTIENATGNETFRIIWSAGDTKSFILAEREF